MKMIGDTLVVVAMVMVLLAMSACSNDLGVPAVTPPVDPTVSLSPCAVESGLDPCQTGFTCYDSRAWPRGGVQGPQEGDLLCHKNCEGNGDCPTNEPVCTSVTLYRGDAGVYRKFCMK